MNHHIHDWVEGPRGGAYCWLGGCNERLSRQEVIERLRLWEALPGSVKALVGASA